MTIDGKLIAVLKGGPGSERQVSLKSGESVGAALRSLGTVNVVDVDVQGVDFALPSSCSLAFNVIHGTFGEDGQLQALLEAKGVPYTGAGVVSSRLAFDKIASKERFLKAGVATPASELWELTVKDSPSMPFPFVVKPPREGSSVGVHIVRDLQGLAAAKADVARFTDVALVETYIQGKELTVGILGDEALPIVHIAPRSGFYDMSNKYPWMSQGAGSDYYVPADLPENTTRQVHAMALAAHRSLGIEVYSRVDFLLTDDLQPFVLEVNTIPGMTESSLLPKAAQALGTDFASLCVRIAELSLLQPRA